MISCEGCIKMEENNSGWQGRINGWSTDMTGQILPFVHPEFPVITEMIGHVFLNNLKRLRYRYFKSVRNSTNNN